MPMGVLMAECSLIAGGAHTLFLTDAGHVYSAGSSNHGQVPYCCCLHLMLPLVVAASSRCCCLLLLLQPTLVVAVYSRCCCPLSLLLLPPQLIFATSQLGHGDKEKKSRPERVMVLFVRYSCCAELAANQGIENALSVSAGDFHSVRTQSSLAAPLLCVHASVPFGQIEICKSFHCAPSHSCLTVESLRWVMCAWQGV